MGLNSMNGMFGIEGLSAHGLAMGRYMPGLQPLASTLYFCHGAAYAHGAAMGWYVSGLWPLA